MDAFGSVALGDLVREVGELFEPIAEDKNVVFVVNANDDLIVRGDRDLLFEAIANLVDNAVKFTPEGGRVDIEVLRRGDDAVIRVRDTGPGVAVGEEDLVTKRFYRSEKSRRDPGLGLGLSLVSAIAKLHGFRFSISPGPGCVTEISGPQAAVSGSPGSTANGASDTRR
jgi:signal transduction histidine kinase